MVNSINYGAKNRAMPTTLSGGDGLKNRIEARAWKKAQATAHKNQIKSENKTLASGKPLSFQDFQNRYNRSLGSFDSYGEFQQFSAQNSGNLYQEYQVYLSQFNTQNNTNTGVSNYTQQTTTSNNPQSSPSLGNQLTQALSYFDGAGSAEQSQNQSWGGMIKDFVSGFFG